MERAQLEATINLVRSITKNGGLINWLTNPWGISAESLTILFLGVVEGLTSQQIIERLCKDKIPSKQRVRRITDMLHDAEKIVEESAPVGKHWHRIIIAIDEWVARDVDKEITGENPALSPARTPSAKAPRKNTFSFPRSCPRCRGSMIPEKDRHGDYATCLLCGYVHEAETVPAEQIEEEVSEQKGRKEPNPRHGGTKLN